MLYISKEISLDFKKIDPRNGLKPLWDKVKSLTNKDPENNYPTHITATDLNIHYASISTDLNYSPPKFRLTAPQSIPFLEEYQLFYLLDHLHPTATGYDNLPAWFLRLTAPYFSLPLSHLINLSFLSHFIPPQWKTAIIRPKAKTKSPSQSADFRPISILPVLTRIVEKQIVSRYIYPSLITPPMNSLLTDQFTFRPTGSTSAAIISILHHTQHLLETNEYVSIISLDFSKAFDSVKHSSLFNKISTLEIPDEIYNWLIESI